MSKEIKQGIYKDKDNKDAPVFLTESTSATLLEQEEKYPMLRQNSVTNAFARITSKANTVINQKDNTGLITTVNGKTTLQTKVAQFDMVTISQSTNRLFRILSIEYAKDQSKSEIVMPLSKYMEITGNKDRRNAKREVSADLEALLNASIKASKESKDKTMTPDTAGMNFLMHYTVEDNIIRAALHPSLVKSFDESSLMAYPVTILKLKSSGNKNPYAQCLADKIAERFKLDMYDIPNQKTKDFTIIGVDSLLKTCASAGMPTYEELQTKNKLQAKMKKLAEINPNIVVEIALGNIPEELIEMIPAGLKMFTTKIIQDLITTKTVDGKPVRSISKMNFRDVNRLIIEPFDKDLDYCAENTDFFQWHYCHPNGVPLTDEELAQKPTYKEFIERRIMIIPRPDYRRANFDAKKLEASHRRKERAKTPKTKKK